MSIPTARGELQTAALRRYLARHGAPQIRLPGRDIEQGRWRHHAACRDGCDPELFFAVRADDQTTYVARQICQGCPVRELCDAEATAARAPGMWAGLWRDDRGQHAMMCQTLLCLRYAAPGRVKCSACYAAVRAATKDPMRVEAGRKADATRKARRGGRQAAPELEVVGG